MSAARSNGTKTSKSIGDESETHGVMARAEILNEQTLTDEPTTMAAPDMSLALDRPLSTKERYATLKISDMDRGIAARAARSFKKFEQVLTVKGVTSATLLNSIDEGERLDVEELRAESQVLRVRGARMLADDKCWRQTLKIADKVRDIEADNPNLAVEFQFLIAYIADRNKGAAAPASAPAAATPANTNK